MKISVNDEIIDTEDIYKIGKVEGNNTWTYINDGHTHSGFYFTIFLYNKKSIEIYLDGDDVFQKNENENGWWFNKSTYLEKLEKVREKIENFREEIINIWSNNQRNIPTFNIK